MPKYGNDSKTIASYLLILGGILAILPNLPVVNETLSIYRYKILSFDGGANFLGNYGTFQNAFSIKGWTPLGLQGEAIWLVFIVIGIAAVISGFLLKNRPVILLSGILGGLIGIGLSILVFLGKHDDLSHFGLSNLSNFEFIGTGFWIILLGSILILIAGLLVLKE